MRAINENANGHACLSQQALKLLLRRRFPPTECTALIGFIVQMQLDQYLKATS